jgi:hypothetical protein
MMKCFKMRIRQEKATTHDGSRRIIPFEKGGLGVGKGGVAVQEVFDGGESIASLLQQLQRD